MIDTPSPDRRSRWLARLLRLYITLMIPVMLVLLSARLVMTPAFLRFEYDRPGFPTDFYGFTQADRLRYAPYALSYLLNAEGIGYLDDLTFPDGSALFNSRELQHMRDVKGITQATFLFAVVAVAGVAAAGYALARKPSTRDDLRGALVAGSLLTYGLILSIVILSVVQWDVFFTGFHNLFFAEGSWMFLYSDTLIRLFPEQFWFDAALVIGGITLLGATIILLAATQRVER